MYLITRYKSYSLSVYILSRTWAKFKKKELESPFGQFPFFKIQNVPAYLSQKNFEKSPISWSMTVLYN